MKLEIALVVALIGWVVTPGMGASVYEAPLANPSFTKGVDHTGLPVGWSKYVGGGKNQKLEIMDGPSGGKALRITDGDPKTEIGVSQAFDLKGGETYQVTAKVRALPGFSTGGAYLQLRFLPSHQLVQTDLSAESAHTYSEVSVQGTAPPDTTKGVIYLYTHRAPTPRVLVTDIKLFGGLPPPPPPPPPPVPPQYDKLKDLHLRIPLVKNGKPNALIVAPASGVYQEAAAIVQQAIERQTGARLAIISDDAPQAAVPIDSHLIVLGNRSTNRTMSALYDRYFALVDLKYPGLEGYVIRTVHNPFGDGRSIAIVGGSDVVGVDRGAKALAGILSMKTPGKGELSLGWTMETRLGRGVEPPTDIKQFETWEASKGYGSIGYFGWCSISKRMAMYYMTGDAFSAREVVRLSFPDERALKDIAEIDGERIENKQDPLAGFYHYNAHLAILFWDLIEESPEFSDEERLRITNAFARQLSHRKNEGVYQLTKAPACVGSRHQQWSAISLYCLGRYFNTHYPHPVWAQCVRGGEWAFRPLHRHAWVSGENDNLFWYNTAIAPVFTYLALTGDRTPLKNGAISELLRGQEILISGRVPDWALNSASIGFLNKAACLTGDGRWIAYRERTGVDTDVFRLGQSFWPDDRIEPKAPNDLADAWSIHPLPEPMWRARNNGFALEESFQFGSFRSAGDATGDFILIDGFNGASRNPYHTFAILELRLGGHTLLKGYRNQIATRMDGLVEPRIAMNAALKVRDVLGSTAVAVAETPDMPYCRWRRTLVQRIGKYALLIDDLTFRADGENMEVQFQWETEHRSRALPEGQLTFAAPLNVPSRKSAGEGRICAADPLNVRTRDRLAMMDWVGPVRRNSRQLFFSLVGLEPTAGEQSLDCVRIDENAAALALPEAAIVVAGANELVEAECAVVAENHLFGKSLTRFSPPHGDPHADPEGIAWLSANHPIDLDWDFASGEMQLAARRDTRLRLVADRGLRLDGKPIEGPAKRNDAIVFNLPAGRHVVTGARFRDAGLSKHLQGLLELGRKRRAQAIAAKESKAPPVLAELKAPAVGNIGGRVTDLAVVGSGAEALIYAAEGNTVHVLGPDGKERRIFKTDGAVRQVRWWDDRALLLAGCADEKVIAFDATGKRKWTFTSAMDPAVFRAAKTYWFKTAPGHEGIHGLHTGTFLNGQSQAFVGSACTLEIIDADGRLIKRMPQFWGKVSHFAIVDDPNGSLNLLTARKYNGVNNVAIVNNQTLNPSPRGFNNVPAGSTFVPGWSSMNRAHLFYKDLDGDGEKEVVGEINGTWNRVSVWSKSGKALYDASFGPGERIPAKNMRDLDVADLDGDGKQEILAATSGGTIVALDATCQKVWAHRIEEPPVAMICVKSKPGARPWIVIGCENGAVIALDGNGRPIRQGRLNGAPTQIASTVDRGGIPLVVFSTDKGEIKWFAASE